MPFDLAIDAATNRVYVGNWANGRPGDLSVIDEESDAVIATIPLTFDPVGVVVDPSTDTVYTAGFVQVGIDQYVSVVSVIDGASNAIVGTVNVPGVPSALAIDPTVNQLFLAQYGDLSVIDTTNDTVSATIALGAGYDGLVADPTRGVVDVAVPAATGGAESVDEVDVLTDQIVHTLTVTGGTTFLTVDPSTALVYLVTDQGLAVIDEATDTLTTTISLSGTGGNAVAVDGTRGIVFATTTPFPSDVSVISESSDSAVGDVSVEGNSVDALAVDPSRGELFIASGPAQTVTVVDESTDLVVATIPIGNAGPP